MHRVPAGAADGPLSRDAALARLEAVLLVAGGSLSSRRLAELAGLADGTQARTLVRRLNEFYDGHGAGNGRQPPDPDATSERAAFRVEEVAGGFQLMTRPGYSPWLRRLHALPAQVRLSTSALETLAVIAYRQPVLRAELEAIRGVQCGEMLRQLGERDLVRIAGRSPELGRPFLYGTTKKFLQVFGLRSLDELPRAVSLRRGNGAIPSEPIPPEPTPSEPTLLQVSQDSTDTKEESAVKIAMLSAPRHDLQDELLAFPPALPLADHPRVDPRGDEDLEEEDDELEDDDDEVEDEEEEAEAEEDDLEEEEWEEVDDDDEEEEDWEDEDDEDWDEDEDEDWEEEEEDEPEA